jgi:hypothetical protein
MDTRFDFIEKFELARTTVNWLMVPRDAPQKRPYRFDLVTLFCNSVSRYQQKYQPDGTAPIAPSKRPGDVTRGPQQR